VKLTLKRDALLAACRLAARLLPEHPISPAEQHFLLRAGPSTSSLRAAGPEACLTLPLAAQVTQPGEVQYFQKREEPGSHRLRELLAP
jgi:hypothetical protein